MTVAAVILLLYAFSCACFAFSFASFSPLGDPTSMPPLGAAAAWSPCESRLVCVMWCVKVR